MVKEYIEIGDKIWRNKDNLCFVITDVKKLFNGLWFGVETLYNRDETTIISSETFKNHYKNKHQRRVDIINEL